MGKLVAIVRDRSDEWWDTVAITDEDDYAEPEVELCQLAVNYFVEHGYGIMCKYYPYLMGFGENPVGDIIENGSELWREMEHDSNMWSSGTIVGNEMLDVPMFVEMAREDDIWMYDYMPEYFRQALTACNQ